MPNTRVSLSKLGAGGTLFRLDFCFSPASQKMTSLSGSLS